MALLIRQAVPTDAAAIGAVHAQSWREAYAGVMSPQWIARVSDRERIRRWRSILADPQPDGPWVAEVDGVVVGFVSAGPARDADPPRPLELWSLYLLESHQGLGIGRALVETAIGDRPAYLNVLRDNAKTIGFYRRMGFEPDGHAGTLSYWENVADIRMVR
ncbi:MAG: acetyltransferase [Rhodoglobus sp.]|nr:acetyltransferase [Rhodoglobus sp.]